MPRGDGTGPRAMGQMTGRGAGYCAGFPTPGYMNPYPARGFGFGRGLGYRRMAWVGRPLRRRIGYRFAGRNW